MENKKWLEILVMILMFGMTSFSGSVSAQDRGLNGTWLHTNTNPTLSFRTDEYRFNNGSFERIMNGTIIYQGTYITNNGDFIWTTIRHRYTASDIDRVNPPANFRTGLYSREEIVSVITRYYEPGLLRELSLSVVASTFVTRTWSYSVIGDKLYMTSVDAAFPDTRLYIKQ